jgi:hypothetical protein
MIALVGRRDSFRFLGLHFLSATFQFAFPGFGAERFGAAFRTAVSFT